MPSKEVFMAEAREAVLAQFLKGGCAIVPQGETVFCIVGPGGRPVGQLALRPATVEYAPADGQGVFFANRPCDGAKPKVIGLADRLDSLPVDLGAMAETVFTAGFAPTIKPSNIVGTNFPVGQNIELLDSLGEVNSLGGLLKQIFGERQKLLVLDIASGFGEFPLELAQKKDELGVEKVIVSDVNPELMQANASALAAVGVEIRKIDVNKAELDGPVDVITLNAPYMGGKDSFVGAAVNFALENLASPGVFILQPHPWDPIPNDCFPKEYPVVQLGGLIGLPSTVCTKEGVGKGGKLKGKSQPYILVKKS